MGELYDALIDRAGLTSRYRDPPEGMMPPPDQGPAILLYDIETTPTLAWVWSAYKTNIIDVHTPSHLLCFGYQWLDHSDIGWVGLNQTPGYDPDTTGDYFVAERLAYLFDAADVTVAHNGDRFDTKKANVYFLRNDLPPPSPYQTVDTFKETKREFAHIKNNLDYLATTHHLGSKMNHEGIDLWLGCMAGDPDRWARMEEYNRQDVELLHNLYVKLRPWIGRPGKKAHPNLGHWAKGERVCTNCGSPELVLDGTHRGQVSEWRTYRCLSCGAYSRARWRVSQRYNKGVAVQ